MTELQLLNNTITLKYEKIDTLFDLVTVEIIASSDRFPWSDLFSQSLGYSMKTKPTTTKPNTKTTTELHRSNYMTRMTWQRKHGLL